METFKSIAYKILKKEGRPLHSKELVKKAIELGLVTNGRTPEATMNAVLIKKNSPSACCGVNTAI